MSTPQEIRQISHIEGIRARPAMYVGSLGPIGIHYLLTQLIDRSVEKLDVGLAAELSVTLRTDGSIEMSDDSGILASCCEDIRPEFVKQIIEGHPAAIRRFQPSAGLHATLEWSVLHALGGVCEINLIRDGMAVRMKSERGNILALEQTTTTAEHSETNYRWLPDPDIFFQSGIHGPMLRDRLRQLCYLHPYCRIHWTDEVTGQTEVIQHPQGIVELIRKMTRNVDSPYDDLVCLRNTSELQSLLTEDLGLTGRNLREQALRTRDQNDWLVFADYLEEQGDPRVPLIRSTWMPQLEPLEAHIEVAFQPTFRKVSLIENFVNDHPTQNGTHVTGFLEAVTRVANDFGRKNGLVKNAVPKGDNYREGLTAVVSVRLSDPVFEGAQRVRLANPEIRNEVRKFTMRGLKSFFEAQPELGTALVCHAQRKDLW